MKVVQKSLQKGFTLIEMLVVAPVVILTIGAFLVVIISMTGEVLSSRASTTLAYNVQDAINRIEQDVKLSTTFLSTNTVSFAPGSQQGYNNDDTTKFTNVGGASGTSLILNTLVTDSNPISLSTSNIYLANTPNGCSSGDVATNTPMTANIVYFVKDSTLWRRTIMPANYNTSGSTCGTPWQQPSCAPNYTSTFCKTNDIKLVTGVAPGGFSIKYFSGGNSGDENTTAADAGASDTARAGALQSAATISVSINASQPTAGRTIERTASLRVTRLDTNASTIASTNPTFYNIINNGSFEMATGDRYVTNTNFQANPSLETDAAGYAAVNGSTVTRLAAAAIDGGGWGLRVAVPSGAISDSGATLNSYLPVTAGNTYTLSAMVRAVTAGTYRMSVQGAYAPITTTSTSFAAGEVKKLSATFTATSNGGQVGYVLRTGTGVAHNFDVDKVAYEVGVAPTEWFSGSSANTADFTTVWTGTANASTSTQSGVRINNLTNAARVAPIQSTEWKSDGSDSLRLVPRSSTSNDSFVSIDNMISGGPSALKPNTTYTFRVKMRLEAPLIGALMAGTQKLGAFIYLNNSLTASYNGTNTTGVQTLGGTFTTPAVMTNYNSIRLYHGGYAGSGDVWYDDLMLIEGNYTGTAYIPGS